MQHKNVYSMSFSSHIASGVDKGVFEVLPSTQSNIKVHSLHLGKEAAAAAFNSSVVESLLVQVFRGATDADIGGSTMNGVLLDNLRGSTHTFAAQQNSSTPGSSQGGAAQLIHSETWITDRPFVWAPPEDKQPTCKLSERLQVRLGASAATITISGTLVVEETGKMPGLSDS